MQTADAPEILADLIAPLNFETFVQAMENARRFHLGGAGRNLSGLVGWNHINAILEHDILVPGASGPVIRLVREGIEVPHHLWFHPFRRPRIDATAFLDLLRQGSTVIVDRIDQLLPNLGRLRDDMSAGLRADIWMNAYLSFGCSPGLPIHFDDHDIVAAQIHGAKLWRFYDEPEQLPVREAIVDIGRRSRTGAVPIAEERLDAGDLLFLPRGEWHDAVNSTEDGPSVHLAIAILPARGIDLVSALRRKALTDPLFRRDVPRFAAAAVQHDYERALKASLLKLVEGLPLAGLLPEGGHTDVPRPASHRQPLVVPQLRPDLFSSGPHRFRLPDLDGGTA